MKTQHPKPSWAMTGALLIALTGFFFTSQIALIGLIAVALLWPHFVAWRYPQDSSAAWLVRLLCYGGIFAFFGGQPGVGADWIFDAKTFNTIGLIAASESLLQAWRVPPENLRFQPLLFLQANIIFLAACNTYNPRYIFFLAPLFIAANLLALGDERLRLRDNQTRFHFSKLRRALALVLVLVCGAALHYGLITNKNRVQSWGVRLMQKRVSQGAGISEQPSLSSTFNLQGSTRRVLLIRGALDDGHLRAAAFDIYAKGRWSPSLSARETENFPEPVSAQNANVARVTKLVDLNKLILAPLNSIDVVPQEGSSFDWSPRLGPILSEEPAPYSYDIHWIESASPRQGVLCKAPTRAELKNLLEVAPDVDPRMIQLAHSIAGDNLDATGKVEAITNFLLKNNQYSLTTKRGPGDPVSSFVLQKKSAHCEYFASAAAILLRCAGVPARYATGYLAHETENGQTTVRSRDAHAWTEAWIDGVGWIVVDATPADGTPLAKPKVSWAQRTMEKLQDAFGRWRESLSHFSRQQLFGFIMFVVIVWLLERWRQARRHKKLVEAERDYSGSPELAQIAARFETFLRKRKIQPHANQTWSETSAAGCEDFLSTYNRARFGGEWDDEMRRDLQRELNELER